MGKLRGRDLALVGQLPPEHAHRPAAWMTYVWVGSADATAQRVHEAGGSVAIEPLGRNAPGPAARAAGPVSGIPSGPLRRELDARRRAPAVAVLVVRDDPQLHAHAAVGDQVAAAAVELHADDLGVPAGDVELL